MKAIREKFRKENQLLKIEVQEKRLEVKKLMLDENVNWNEVKKVLNEKAAKEVELEIRQMKHRKLIEEKFGIKPNFEKRRNGKGNKEKRNIKNNYE